MYIPKPVFVIWILRPRAEKRSALGKGRGVEEGGAGTSHAGVENLNSQRGVQNLDDQAPGREKAGLGQGQGGVRDGAAESSQPGVGSLNSEPGYQPGV